MRQRLIVIMFGTTMLAGCSSQAQLPYQAIRAHNSLDDANPPYDVPTTMSTVRIGNTFYTNIPGVGMATTTPTAAGFYSTNIPGIGTGITTPLSSGYSQTVIPGVGRATTTPFGLTTFTPDE